MNQSDRADVRADLKRRAGIIADSLVMAFGGASQVSPEDAGHAVAGQIANNGLTVHGTVYEACVAVYEATLLGGDDHYPAEEPDYDGFLPRMVGACLARLGNEPALPYPLAHPERQCSGW